jgi:hypothetical protein
VINRKFYVANLRNNTFPKKVKTIFNKINHKDIEYLINTIYSDSNKHIIFDFETWKKSEYIDNIEKQITNFDPYIINNNLPIDIYGRGCQFLPEHLRNRPNIKGIFNETEPYDDYIFTISIENFTSNHYFSEKIISPIMCGTIPIYLGCKNIEKYVKDFCVPMTGVYKDDIELILDVLKKPYQYMKDVKTSKEEIFNNLNFIKNVKNLF